MTLRLAESRRHPPDAHLDDFCTQSRFGGPGEYLDSTTTAVFQWYDAGPDLSFPYQPQQLDLDLFFADNGASDDSVTLSIALSCPSFGQICCTPRLQDCVGQITVARGTPFPALRQYTIDLTPFDCCFDSGFWAVVVIDSISSGTDFPSFLFSSADNDPNPVPPCEQWLITGQEFVNEPVNDLGWASLRLSGNCDSCIAASPVVCDTAGSGSLLNCDQILNVNCGANALTLTNQTNSGLQNNTDDYCCAPWDESGPEKIYSIDVPYNGSLIVDVHNMQGGDLDLFILEECAAQSCIAAADSAIQLLELTHGTYFIVIDGFEGAVATFDITFTCYGDCSAEICMADLTFGSPPGNLYLDGEWDRTLGNIYYSYYPGSGTEQTILGGDPDSCNLSPVVTWNSVLDAPNRMLAADPRNGGQFWCGIIDDYESGSGCMYLINSSGAVVHSWTAIANLPIMRWSGAAFDPDNNHLWILIRDSADAGQSRAYELDVGNPAAPLVIQGPHLLPNLSPHASLSSGGADYSDEVDELVVVHQGFPVDYLECYLDIQPDYSGPPPGPGLAGEAWCSPDSNRIQGFGVAAYDDGGADGELLMTNFTDGDFTHPLNRYPGPCDLRLPDCPPVSDLVVRKNASVITLNWTPPQLGLFQIYSSTNPDNDGDPDGGADSDFFLEATVFAGGPTSWNDSSSLVPYKIYVIIANCL